MKPLSLIFFMLFSATLLFAQQSGSKPKPVTQSRSAKTGQYVTKSYANSHPSTTYTTQPRRRKN